MNPDEFRIALRSDRRLYGTLITSTSPVWPKAIDDCGLDFVFIDTEHIAIGRETLSWMCRTYAALGLPPLVRVTDPDPDKVTVAYDDGAAAVVAPYIENPDQVRSLVGAAKYRPLKGEKLAGALSGEPLEEPLAEYVASNSAGNSLLVNIESVAALGRLDQLIEVGGFEALLIGPHDLSCSLGLPEQYDHPDFLKAVEKVFRSARDQGLGAGIHFWGTEDEHVRLLDMGATFLIHKADVILFRTHLKSELAAIRERAGDKTDNVSEDPINI